MAAYQVWLVQAGLAAVAFVALGAFVVAVFRDREYLGQLFVSFGVLCLVAIAMVVVDGMGRG